MALFESEPVDAPRRGKILLLPILIAAAVMVFQYLGAEKVEMPETGKVVRVALSSDQEQALGLESYQAVLQQSQEVSGGPELDEAKRVSERLVSVLDPQSRKFQWAVSVIENREQNAFCLPGGKIVVYTGIFPIAQNDDGLATVLGHEIAHATQHHGSRRLLHQELLQTAMMGAQASLANMDYSKRRMVLGALGAGAQFGVVLPYSREDESEADEVGLHYMVRAGFNPYEAVKFWERMEQAADSRGQPPEWASTHPSQGTRIQRIKALIPAVLQKEKGGASTQSNESPKESE